METEMPTTTTTTTVPTPKAGKTKKLVKKAKGIKAKLNGKAKAKREKKDGLRKPQIRILQALVKTKKPNGEMSRGEIAEASETDLAMLNSYIGSRDLKIRAKNDKAIMPSLLTLKCVTEDVQPTENGGEGPVHHAITATGRKMLEKALEEVKAAK